MVTVKKRIRRSPEILKQELEDKMKKLEERIYKKNKDAVHIIGKAILKRADFDFSNLTQEDLEDIENSTPKGSSYIDDIIKKASKE